MSVEKPSGADHQDTLPGGSFPIPERKSLLRSDKPITREGLIADYDLDPTDPQTGHVLNEIMGVVQKARIPHLLSALAEGRIRSLKREQATASTNPQILG